MKRILLLILIISVLLVSCAGVSDEPVSRTGLHMGTVITITAYGGDKKAMDAAFDEIIRLESLFSRNITDSDISRINASAGEDLIDLSTDTKQLIEAAMEYYIASRGYFDITIGPLVDLWGIGTDDARVPDEDEIKEALELKGVDKLKYGGSVGLQTEGMSLDLGGIAKGYIADKVAKVLKDKGCSGGVINLGGNVLTFGVKPDGSKWRIGIQDPFEPTGNYMEVVSIDEMSVVTSGPYERNFEENGVIYHHILDPFTGYPAESDIAGVTIISKESLDGDVLSTTVFTWGSEKGMSLIENTEDTECYMVLEDGSVIMSSGFSKYLD